MTQNDFLVCVSVRKGPKNKLKEKLEPLLLTACPLLIFFFFFFTGDEAARRGALGMECYWYCKSLEVDSFSLGSSIQCSTRAIATTNNTFTARARARNNQRIGLDRRGDLFFLSWKIILNVKLSSALRILYLRVDDDARCKMISFAPLRRAVQYARTESFPFPLSFVPPYPHPPPN